MNPRKAELLRELDRTRSGIQRDFRELAGELDVVKKTGRLMAKKPFHWMAGAALAGFVISGGLFRRGRRRERPAQEGKPRKSGGRKGPAGMLLLVFKMIFPLIKPALAAYATRKMADLATGVR